MDSRDEALRQAVREIRLMGTATEVGRGEWVQLPDGQWVKVEQAGNGLDEDRQAAAGEESQDWPDDL